MEDDGKERTRVDSNQTDACLSTYAHTTHHEPPQTIWAPITVAQTMSSHPSSAFKSGMNRVMGTVMGAIFGLAVTQVGPLVLTYMLVDFGPTPPLTSTLHKHATTVGPHPRVVAHRARPDAVGLHLRLQPRQRHLRGSGRLGGPDGACRGKHTHNGATTM